MRVPDLNRLSTPVRQFIMSNRRLLLIQDISFEGNDGIWLSLAPVIFNLDCTVSCIHLDSGPNWGQLARLRSEWASVGLIGPWPEEGYPDPKWPCCNSKTPGYHEDHLCE